MDLNNGKCSVTHLPEDIANKTPWGDEILTGTVEAVGDEDHEAWIGHTVSFSRRDANIVEEGEENERWIVSYENILEWE
jgi:hypothetical protein